MFPVGLYKVQLWESHQPPPHRLHHHRLALLHWNQRTVKINGTEHHRSQGKGLTCLTFNHQGLASVDFVHLLPVITILADVAVLNV